MQLFKKHIENMIKEKQKGIDIYMVEKDRVIGQNVLMKTAFKP